MPRFHKQFTDLGEADAVLSESPSADLTNRYSDDQELRKAGLTIHARPRTGEAVWRFRRPGANSLYMTEEKAHQFVEARRQMNGGKE